MASDVSFPFYCDKDVAHAFIVLLSCRSSPILCSIARSNGNTFLYLVLVIFIVSKRFVTLPQILIFSILKVPFVPFETMCVFFLPLHRQGTSGKFVSEPFQDLPYERAFRSGTSCLTDPMKIFGLQPLDRTSKGRHVSFLFTISFSSIPSTTEDLSDGPGIYNRVTNGCGYHNRTRTWHDLVTISLLSSRIEARARDASAATPETKEHAPCGIARIQSNRTRFCKYVE